MHIVTLLSEATHTEGLCVIPVQLSSPYVRGHYMQPLHNSHITGSCMQPCKTPILQGTVCNPHASPIWGEVTYNPYLRGMCATPYENLILEGVAHIPHYRGVACNPHTSPFQRWLSTTSMQSGISRSYFKRQLVEYLPFDCELIYDWRVKWVTWVF